VLVDPGGRRVSIDPAHLVPHSIDECLTEIRLQRTLVPRLEVVDVAEGLRERLLDQIFGVAKIASPSRETSTRPSPERASTPLNQIVERLRIALAGAAQQVRRRGKIGRLWFRVTHEHQD